MLVITIFLVALVVSSTTLRCMLNSRLAIMLLDETSKAHALHSHVTPRMGGIGIVLSALLVWLGWANFVDIESRSTLTLLCLFAVIVFGVSLVDDLRGLSALKRLIFQVCVAATTVYLFDTKMWIAETHSLHGFVLIFVLFCTVIAIVWFVNLYNFLDGANGLAGLMGVVGFASFAYVAHFDLSSAGDMVAIFSVAVSGACAGFLVFNFPHARLFMGDCGSITLGFLAATLGLLGAINQLWPWWFPLLIFSPFIVDASATLAKRVIKRERIWEGHRQHYYQRLILVLGWSHTKTTLAYACLMLCVAVTSLIALDQARSGRGAHPSNWIAPEAILFLAWVVIYVLLLTCLEWRFSEKNKKNSNKNKNV